MSEKAKKGRRRLERKEIKGDPYEFISKYQMSISKDQVLRLLYDMRIAKVSHIQRHLGTSQRWTQQILADLYVNNFVYRKFAMVSSGSAEGMYFLDSMGAFYLAMANDMTRREFPWLSKDNAVAPEKTQHTLAITEIRLAIEEATRKRNDIELRKFWGEKRSGRRRFESQKQVQEISMDSELELLYEICGKKYLETLFLEYDSGYEDIRQIKDKIIRYDQYYESKEFKERYQTEPDIIIICENELSMRRFVTVIENVSKDKRRFWICLNKDVLRDPFGIEIKSAAGEIRRGIVNLMIG